MEAEAARSLLLGLLALQMDFITRDQLVAVFQVWMLDKTNQLDEILVKQNCLCETDRQLLLPGRGLSESFERGTIDPPFDRLERGRLARFPNEVGELATWPIDRQVEDRSQRG